MNIFESFMGFNSKLRENINMPTNFNNREEEKEKWLKVTEIEII